MGSDKVRKGGQSKKYNQRLKAAETAFEATQKSLQAETARQQRIVEKNLILSELLYCADRLQSVYEKHLAWLETGGSGQQQPGSSRACDHHEQHSCMQQVRMGQQKELHDDVHWIIYLLETATWEQLQHVLAMTTADWVEYHRQYCGDLIRLFEVSLRCPEVQDIMLAGVDVPKLSAEDMPTAAASFATSSRVAAESSGSDSGMTDAPRNTPASDLILQMLKNTGSIAYVALLHGLPAIFDAATKNVLTGEDCEAPPSHWVNVAQRMRFSRQQKLHFKLAMQNFARQARAAAARGLSVLQETPSYAFLMACQDIAMRQLSSEDNSLQGSADAAAAAQQPAGDAAARAAQEGSSRAAQSLGNHADGSAGVLGPACGFAGTASAGGAARGGVSTGGQQQQFNPPHTATAAAGGVSTRGQQQQFNQLHPAAAAAGGVSTAGQQQQQLRQQEGQAVVDVDAPSSPTRALQHQLGLYYRQVVNLNIFLADTLTLEQALTLNIASYPFWPNLSAVAEAAIQLPDEPEAPTLQARQQGVQQGQECVELLMRKRRSFMQQAHFEWWQDYGRPGAGAPHE